MEKHFLDPDTLLGRIVTSQDKYEIVHLSLNAGNEVPEYKNEAEIVEIPSNVAHRMAAVKDSQLMAVKIKK